MDLNLVSDTTAEIYWHQDLSLVLDSLETEVTSASDSLLIKSLFVLWIFISSTISLIKILQESS